MHQGRAAAAQAERRDRGGIVNRAARGVLFAGLAAGTGAWYAFSRARRGSAEADPFRDRVALVMGGSRGLGFLLGRDLARRGCRVVLAARDLFELVRAQSVLRAEGLEVFIFVCDVTDRGRVEAVVRVVEASVGPVDVLGERCGDDYGGSH